MQFIKFSHSDSYYKMTEPDSGTNWQNKRGKELSVRKHDYSIEMPEMNEHGLRIKPSQTDEQNLNTPDDHGNNEEIHLVIDQTIQIGRETWTNGFRGTALSVAYFLTTATILIFGMNFVHKRMPRDVPPLPDLGHEITPHLKPEKLGDVTMMTLIVTFIVSVFLHNRRWPILIKFLQTMGNLYLLRVISILVTSLPPTENHCRYEYQEIDNIYWNTLKGLITLGGNNIHCGDLMFSGHTCMVTNVWMVFMRNYKRGHFLKFFSTIVLLLTLFFIIATRSHYTIDVWIAFWLTVLVHKASPSSFPFTKKKISRFFRTCF